MSIVRFDDSAENHPDFASGWTWWPTQPKQSSISQGGDKLQVESEPGRDWWRKPGHDAKDGEGEVSRSSLRVHCVTEALIPISCLIAIGPYGTFVQYEGEAFVRLLPPSHFGKDFSASVVMSGDWKAQYDQGTIFLYVLEDGGSSRWVKVGVEREDDKDWIGYVMCSLVSAG
jgi:regulation of enolase protein 1 (concanavalin A-like superfamily)